jgi:hypothetical protein
MSTKIKERLKKLALELDHQERMLLDNGLVQFTKAKDCDEAIEMMSDDQAKCLLKEMGNDSLRDIVLIPLSGLIVDNIGRE